MPGVGRQFCYPRNLLGISCNQYFHLLLTEKKMRCFKDSSPRKQEKDSPTQRSQQLHICVSYQESKKLTLKCLVSTPQIPIGFSTSYKHLLITTGQNVLEWFLFVFLSGPLTLDRNSWRTCPSKKPIVISTAFRKALCFDEGMCWLVAALEPGPQRMLPWLL